MKKLIFVLLFIFLQDKLLFATPFWTISGTLVDINGNNLHDYNIISYTVNSNTWPGYPFNQFFTHTNTGANGTSGLGFSNSTGQFAWNLTAFGVNYYPVNGITTIQCIFNTTCGTTDTGVQIFSPPQGGAFPQNLGTFSTSGSCLLVSPPGTLAVGQNGIPAQNGSGVDFSAVGGGNLGSLSPATSGTETMSLTQLGGFVGTTKVAAVFELGNCQNPPYNVTFFLPASSLAGLNGNLAVVHN
ncbi:hypothetical protein IT568_06925, partial [bacterium]|nr:hypothetical protein [bacterium]